MLNFGDIADDTFDREDDENNDDLLEDDDDEEDWDDEEEEEDPDDYEEDDEEFELAELRETNSLPNELYDYENDYSEECD